MAKVPWKVCIHWSAGAYTLTGIDKLAYHFTVNKDGGVVAGVYRPENNTPKSMMEGKYAKHCGGGNTYCIGVSLLGMAGYSGPSSLGAYPLTEKQGEAAWKKVAQLCRQYSIPVTADRVFTHYEFGKSHPGSTSAGKIDITHLPYAPEIPATEVGDYIRTKVAWYLKQK